MIDARAWFIAAFILLGATGCATAPASTDATAEVRAAEVAFARSMADRDFARFASFIADDAVFLNGGQPLRGKPAILAFWQRFFAEPAAPFSWRPEVVEVSGALGATEGPVASPQGKVFARFYSTWRRSSSGAWLVVFDNGYRVCE